MRHHDWDIRLMEYVDQCRDKPFDWANFDCLTFVNECSKKMTGKGFADDWLDQDYECATSAVRVYKSKLKSANEKDIVAGIDDRLVRSTGLYPRRGDVVGRQDAKVKGIGLALGIAVSDLVAFIGSDGIEFDQPRDGDIFWAVS